MRTVAIIQARMGSTRLPGKVLADLAGRPMVHHVVDRARLIRGVDEVVAAIPALPGDDELAEVLASLGIEVMRGPTDDVLARYAGAARASEADVIVRITADCPLLSPSVSSDVVAAFAEGAVDYASNTVARTYPRGLDTEVLSARVLETANREATDARDREHVTRFVWRQPNRFQLRSIVAPTDRSGMRWTVDTIDDLAFARAVHEALGPGPFDVPEILGLLDRRPDLTALNASVAQKPVD